MSFLKEYTVIYGEALESGIDDNLFQDVFGGFTVEDIIHRLNTGELSVSADELTEWLLSMLLGEVYDGIRLMAIVLALSVLSSYLSGLKSGLCFCNIRYSFLCVLYSNIGACCIGVL